MESVSTDLLPAGGRIALLSHDPAKSESGCSDLQRHHEQLCRKERHLQLVNVHEAKTQLSKLLDRVAAGEEVVIARHGKPVAKLSPMAEELPPRKPGILKGKIWIADNFDEFDEELEEMFYGPKE
jgi:prevent-host-death family protein